MRTEYDNVLSFPTAPQNEEAYAEKLEDLRKGKLKKRFYAFCTDLFFIGVIQKALVLTYATFVNNSLFNSQVDIKNILVTNLYQMRLSTLVFTFFSYFLISLYLGHGKTIGKTFFNLRIVSHEGDPHELSFMESFMRTMGYTTCYITQGILFAMVLFNKDGRGLPDLFSQTEVLTDEEFVLLYESASDDSPSLTSDNEQLDLFSA